MNGSSKKLLAILIALLAGGPSVWAQQYLVQGGSFASGTMLASGSGFAIYGTAGQPAIGSGADAVFAVNGGFWPQSQGIVTDVDQEEGSLPREFRLDQNYPNPFNPSTTIRFALPAAGAVELKVYDALGREVTTLANGPMAAGEYSVVFDARNLASGVYFYRLTTSSFVQTRKLMLLR